MSLTVIIPPTDVSPTTGTGNAVLATSPTLTTPISASLTSPAATPLTLGTGTSGAAITVLSASNNVGIGTTTPSQKLSLNGTMQWAQTADAGYSGYLTNASTNAAYNPAITRNLIGSTDSTYTIAHGDMDAYAGIQFGISGTNTNAGNISFFAASGTFATNESVTPVARMFIANTGDVSISSTTAGSAGAGALIVQGGISAGQSAQASFIGGNLTVGAQTGALSLPDKPDSLIMSLGYPATSTPTNQQLKISLGNVSGTEAYGFTTDNIARVWYHAGNSSSGSGGHVLATGGTARLTIDGTTATFAGAVTANGTLTNTAAQLGTFTSTTANGTSGEGNFTVVSSNTNTDIAYGINRAPGIAIRNTSGTANSYGGISFQDGGSNATSSIFGIFENDANNTGSLQFATRPSGGSLTTALTLASTGAATFAGAVTVGGDLTVSGNTITLGASNAVETHTQVTAGVSTTDTIIHSASSANYGGLVIVSGSDGGSAQFCDIVGMGYSTAAAIQSNTVGGSPSARTYTGVAGALKLAMASGTYSIRSVGTKTGGP